jgi:RNA polymerase sigma-70 factor (ECF subfamily)
MSDESDAEKLRSDESSADESAADESGAAGFSGDEPSDDDFDDDESTTGAPDPDGAGDGESDDALLEAWQQRGDKRAGDRLIRRYLPGLRRYFRNKVASRADEEDLIQQVFEGLVKAMPKFRKQSSLRTFLLRVARNKRRDYFRAKARKRDIMDIDELSVAELIPGPSSIQSRNRRQAMLIQGLRMLSLADQELLELRYWEEPTVPEIAEILAIPEAAVKSRLRRAKERLRKAMETLAESDEEIEFARTGDLDQWAEDVRRQQLGRRPGSSSHE